MGNWTTVHIYGICNENDVDALSNAINTGDDWRKFHCLCNSGGLCGLGDWAGERINVVGNLAERDYGTSDIVQQLKKLAEVAPSLDVVIHVGGDYESLECVDTIKCKNGEVTIVEPQIKTLPSIPEERIRENLMKAIMR